MTAHPYPELRHKLALLKLKQRQAQYRYCWRSLVASGFVASLLFCFTSSYWQISKPEQILFQGNRLIDTTAVYQTLADDSDRAFFFQNLVPWAIDSQQIDRQLEAIPALKSVKVSKTIFPPLVKIYLQERIPVATAISSGKVGFLDDRGVWLEPNWYLENSQEFPLTKIKVINFQNQYREVWTEIFRLLTAYPNIEVKEVSWGEEGNVAIVTSQIKAFLGTNHSLLEHQFSTLASFADLSNNPNLQEFSTIDLSNPDNLFLKQ